MTLLGLSGNARAGKDTAARILVARRGRRQQALAHAVKDEVFQAFGRFVLIGHFPHLVPTLQDWIDFFEEHKEDPPQSRWHWLRWAHQGWATEYRRAQCPTYWLERIDLASDVVISDVRFANEVDVIHSLGGVIWRIERPGAHSATHGLLTHTSESQVQMLTVDRVVVNDGTWRFARRVLDAYDADGLGG